MIITCPECATEFKTPDSVFAEGPRKLRCAKCSYVWTHDPADAAQPPADKSDSDSMETELSGPVQDGGDQSSDNVDFDNLDSIPAEDGLNEANGEVSAESSGSDEDKAGEADASGQDSSVQDSDDQLEGGDAALDEDGIKADGAGDEADADAGEKAGADSHDIESEAAGLPGEDKRSKLALAGLHLGKWASAAAAILMLAAGGYGSYAFRDEITRFVPAAAPVYVMLGVPVNLTGLEFSDVGIGRGFDNGFPVLSVKGKLTNVSDSARPIPDIRFALRSPDKQEVYHWTIKVKRIPLQPNETVQFTTRLASPPTEAEDIVIRFQRKSGLKIGAL